VIKKKSLEKVPKRTLAEKQGRRCIQINKLQIKQKNNKPVIPANLIMKLRNKSSPKQVTKSLILPKRAIHKDTEKMRSSFNQERMIQSEVRKPEEATMEQFLEEGSPRQ